ncbi:hypothetical protein GCM10025787_58390 [Saccharopolyspora rosea]|uniref:Uncharacterized protein n=1 Tax=Saccharopolyspora rosea TaxID=524884 RepID=A0ABW3FXL3_9PSEU
MKVAVIGPGELAAQDVGHSHPADVLSDFRPRRLADRTEFAPLRPARSAGQQ